VRHARAGWDCGFLIGLVVRVGYCKGLRGKGHEWPELPEWTNEQQRVLNLTAKTSEIAEMIRGCCGSRIGDNREGFAGSGSLGGVNRNKKPGEQERDFYSESIRVTTNGCS
jgi:hypothetical protein